MPEHMALDVHALGTELWYVHSATLMNVLHTWAHGFVRVRLALFTRGHVVSNTLTHINFRKALLLLAPSKLILSIAYKVRL